jgi:hypothetical protein
MYHCHFVYNKFRMDYLGIDSGTRIDVSLGMTVYCAVGDGIGLYGIIDRLLIILNVCCIVRCNLKNIE